jgi:hypothetical protein
MRTKRFRELSETDGSRLRTAANAVTTGERKTINMKSATKNMARVAVIALIIAAASSDGLGAGIKLGAQAITLNATLAESLTLSLTANAVQLHFDCGQRDQCRQHQHHCHHRLDVEGQPDSRGSLCLFHHCCQRFD